LPITPNGQQHKGNKMTTSAQSLAQYKENQMYGVNDINAYIALIKTSITYKLTGANMVVAGLMSDAQEEMAHGNDEGARKTLNRAKAVLFQIMDGSLVGTVERI
jgi:hypothetical protein